MSVHLGGNHFLRRTNCELTIVSVENNSCFNGTKPS